MAGAVRGGLRPHHPTKHVFLLIGLIVIVIVLGINYWNTSVKNSRLLTELAKLQKNYKLCAEQFGQLSGEKKKQENAANERDRDLEDTRRRLVDKEADVVKMQSLQRRYEDELEQCRNNVTTTLQQSRVQLEACEGKVERVKLEQQQACSQQTQTALDQLRQQHILDKTKAIEDAVLAQKRQQQTEQARLAQQQQPVRRKKSAPQQLLEQWRQKLQDGVEQRKVERRAEQWPQQLEAVHQQKQSQYPKQQQQLSWKEQPAYQQQQQYPQHQPLLGKEQPQKQQLQGQQQAEQRSQQFEPANQQQQQYAMQQQQQPLLAKEQPQNQQPQGQLQDAAVQHQPAAEPVQPPQQQPQQNSLQKLFDERQQQRGMQPQLPIDWQRNMPLEAPRPQNQNQPLQQEDNKQLPQQPLPNIPDQQQQQVPQDVAPQAQRKVADEQLRPVNGQPPNQVPQQPELNSLQQQPELQKPQQPLLFQVPAPVPGRDYKRSVDEQRAKDEVPASRPEWKQQLIDVNRQQQFDQLQQDVVPEHFRSQKENDRVRPLMVPQQAEDQPSLLGNAREPPHHEGVIHMTGQMSSGIKDVAVRAPDGSLGQIDHLRNDQLGQQGVAPGFENIQAPVPARESVNHLANIGQDSVRDESQRDYGQLGHREADFNRHANQKQVEPKAQDEAADLDEYGARDERGLSAH